MTDIRHRPPSWILTAAALGLTLCLGCTTVSAQQACLAPGLEVDIFNAAWSADGTSSFVLHFNDPNTADVSGYNIYRSADASLQASFWTLMALDATDEDGATAGIQWSDTSGDVSATGIFFYLVAAYNGACNAEGPWMTITVEDADGDGVADSDDLCPTTPEGADLIPGGPTAPASADELVPGCAATDLLLRPEVLVGPIGEGISEFFVSNEAASTPAATVDGLTSAQLGLESVFDELWSAAPCAAAASFGTVVGDMNGALLGIEEYLLELPAAPEALEGGAGGDDGTEGPIVWPSPEYLYWAGQHYSLSALTDVAAQASDVTVEVCNSKGASRTIDGLVTLVSDEQRLVSLLDGEKIIMPWNASIQGGGELAKEFEVNVQATDYGNVTVGNVFGTAPSTYPVIENSLYDDCLQLRVLPIQPLPHFPERQNSWILHALEGYLGPGPQLEFEAGTRLIAEDNGCPGVIAGGGPQGQDLWIEYFYDVLLSYKPKQGSWVTNMPLTYEFDGESNPVFIPDMDPAVNGIFVVRKLKRTCLASGLTIPYLDQDGEEQQWDVRHCSSAQLVEPSTAYAIRVRNAFSYCLADYSATYFDIEDHQPSDWRQTRVQTLSVSPSQVPGPLTFSAIGDKIVNGTPVHDQVVGLQQDFAIYNPFGHTHTRLGTDNSSFLEWPHITGARNNESFRYACRVPPLVTDEVDSCQGVPWTFYRLPFPQNTSTTVTQGNGGTFSHNTWQFFALDLVGSEGDPLTAARGGRVVKLRQNMTLNCKNQTCTNYGFPLLDEYGNHIAIQHQDGTVSWYAHMKPFTAAVNLNQVVKRGDYLGQMGNTGESTNAHLHFHVTPKDPSLWGNTTVLARYQVYNPLSQNVESCMVPLQGFSYISTNN